MFIYISIKSNWDKSLSNFQMRQLSKPMGTTIIDYCYILNRKQKFFKMLKWKTSQTVYEISM